MTYYAKLYLSKFHLVHPMNKDIHDILGLTSPVINNRRLLWNRSWGFKIKIVMNLYKWQFLLGTYKN